MERVEPFLDHWTYLKVELNWLERLLLTTVARQRKDIKDVERVAQNKADRATSYWWKGMVNLDGSASYDSPAEKRKSEPDKPSYQQQLDARIRVTQEQGIPLALPALCDRVQLSVFEKNVLLLGLAPEIHRRYGQLYGYLQSGKEFSALPTVDLALRLFCRTDAEWRVARSQLSESGLLRQHQLVEFLDHDQPLLQRSFRLPDQWVNYFLEEPQYQLDRLLGHPGLEVCEVPNVEFSELVLPDALLNRLLKIGQQIQFAPKLETEWGLESSNAGLVALMVGASGTGKTMAVRAIATRLKVSMATLDLAGLSLSEQRQVLQNIEQLAPKVLVIRSAESWLGKSTGLSDSEMTRFLKNRRSHACLTVLQVDRLPAISRLWRSHLSETLRFPKPDRAMRVQLWKQAFSERVPLDQAIDWEVLAEKGLTGGEIGEIARAAAVDAIAEDGQGALEMRHLIGALDNLVGRQAGA
jgi:hypothetical protein